MLTPPPGAEDLLMRARRALAIGQTWWIDGAYARKPAYGYVIDILQGEGFDVIRESDLVTVSVPEGKVLP